MHLVTILRSSLLATLCRGHHRLWAVLQIGDLGVSKLLKEGAASTQIGTPYYMAPELFMQKSYGVGSDLWALGCLLYEMITLRCDR